MTRTLFRWTAGVMALIATLLIGACYPRIPWVEGRFDPTPDITIMLIDVAAETTYFESTYAEVLDQETIAVPPGLELTVFVRAVGRNGVGSLKVEATIDGNPIATATALEGIDSNGYIASTLVIAGTDGAGGAGSQPIRFKLNDGQAGVLATRAAGAFGSPRLMTLKITTTCDCPSRSYFDKHCNCGCSPYGSNISKPQLSNFTLQPLCGGWSCCDKSESCINNRCGIDPRICASGGICPIYAPICRDELCYPF